MLARTYAYLTEAVSKAGLIITPENVQQSGPWKYLGHIVFHWNIWPQTLQINPPKCPTLNNLQQQ